MTMHLQVHQEQTQPETILKAFTSSPAGLTTFKREDPAGGDLQFLDLHISLRTERICWEFKQRSEKPVLPFTSAHSKTVKLGLVRSLLTAAHARSCPHLATHSVSLQLDRLRKAGYPEDLMENNLDRLRLTT
ncbi:unnamed protein product, partial [Ixodes persulcatus]